MAYNTTHTDTLTSQSAACQRMVGSVVYDGTSITTTDYTRIACGFKPRYIKWVNLTDRIQIEWYAGMTASQTLLTVAAGTRTLDTTANAVVVDDTGFSILQDNTLAAILASKTCMFVAEG